MSGTKKKKWPIILGILVIVLVVFVSCGVAAAKSLSAAPTVSVATVSSGDISSQIDVSGTVASEETKVYFSTITGQIKSVEVAAGDKVKAGDRLVTYDMEKLEAQDEVASLQAQAEQYGITANVQSIQKAQSDYTEAVANYDEAMQYVNHWSARLESNRKRYNEAMEIKNEYDMLKATVDQYKISQADYETPNPELASLIEQGEARLNELSARMADYDYAELESAVSTCSSELSNYKALAQQYEAQKVENPSLGSQKAQQSTLRELSNLTREQAEEALEDARKGISADFNGVVTQISVVEGQAAPEGTQLLVLESTDSVMVSVGINKYDLAQIAEGQRAVITINGNEYEGYVKKINRMGQLDASGNATVTAQIHIDQPDDNIYLGIEAKVKIESATEENALLVPIQCVNYDTKGAFCYVVEEGVIVRRDVTAGISSDTHVQVISGLKAGEQVITDVTTDLNEGMGVIPVPEG